MIASHRLLLVVLTVTAAAAIAQSPARATWHVDHVDWTYGNRASGNWPLIDPATNIVVGHECVMVSNGDARVVLCAYAKVDGGGSPIRVNVTLAAVSQLKAKVVLAGSPPPPKPTTWSQHSYVAGQWSLHIDEVVPFAGGYEATATSRFGAPAPPPCPYLHVTHSLYSSRDDAHMSTGGSQYAEEQNWFSRPAGTAYKAAYVQAEAEIDLQGEPPGKVAIDAWTWANDFGIATMPGPVYWPAS